MNEFLLPYLLISAHFVSGAIWLININRKLDPGSSKKQWIKFTLYIVLFNLIWFSMVCFDALFFPLLGYLIIAIGSWEWWNAIKQNSQKIGLTIGFILVMVGFWKFLYLDKNDILFTFFVVVLFDGSSQIIGQLLGKRQLAPKISPRKTIEGLAGGALVTLLTSLLTKHTFSLGWMELILMTCILMIAAFAGDLLASIIKRKANIKSYSKALPGHGGILDRYDSLILAGSVMYIIHLIKISV